MNREERIQELVGMISPYPGSLRAILTRTWENIFDFDLSAEDAKEEASEALRRYKKNLELSEEPCEPK